MDFPAFDSPKPLATLSSGGRRKRDRNQTPTVQASQPSGNLVDILDMSPPAPPSSGENFTATSIFGSGPISSAPPPVFTSTPQVMTPAPPVAAAAPASRAVKPPAPAPGSLESMREYRQMHPLSGPSKTRFTFTIPVQTPPVLGVAVVLPPVPEESAAPAPEVKMVSESHTLEPDSQETSQIVSRALHSEDVFGLEDALADLRCSSAVIKPLISEKVALPRPIELERMRCYEVFEGYKAK